MIGTNEIGFRITDGPVIVPGASETTTAAVTDEYGNPIKGERDPKQEALFEEANNKRKTENQTTTSYYSGYTGDQWSDNSGSQWTDNSGSQWTDNSGSQWTDNSGSQWSDNSDNQWSDNNYGSSVSETQWSGDSSSDYGTVTTDNSGYTDNSGVQDAQW